MVKETDPGAAADVLLRIKMVAISAKESAQILNIGFMSKEYGVKHIFTYQVYSKKTICQIFKQ